MFSYFHPSVPLTGQAAGQFIQQTDSVQLPNGQIQEIFYTTRYHLNMTISLRKNEAHISPLIAESV